MSFKEFLAQVHYLNHPYLSGPGAIFLVVLGFFVLSKSKHFASARVFCLIMWASAIWFFANALSMTYYSQPNTSFFWWQVGYTGVPFISVAAYHYYHVQYEKNKHILYFLYAIAVAEVFLAWSFNPTRLNFYAVRNVGIIFHDNMLIYWFLVFGMTKFTILSIATGLCFLNKYKQETTPLKRQQLKFSAIMFFMLTIGALEWLVTFDIPLHIGWIAVVFFFVPMAYGITRYRLMDIHVFISRGLAGIMLFTIFGIMHLCLFKLFERILGSAGALLLSLALVGWIGLFSPLRVTIQQWINKIVLKGKYDYQEVLREATHAVVTILDLEELLFYLIDIIRGSLNVRTLAFLLKNEPEGDYVLRWADGVKQDLLGNYVIENGVIEWIKKKKTVFVKEEQSMALSRREFVALSKDIEEINAEIIVPLFYKGRLEGLLALDHKATKEPYIQSDITLLEGLASQAIIAIKNAQLYEEAITDSLTGLFHHKYFLLRLEEELTRARRYKHSLGLLMIDLDNFKVINDRFGHQTGDDVLVRVAQIIKNSTRKSDIVSRYGGEEFSVILPESEVNKKNSSTNNMHTVPQGIMVIAERLRKNIENEIFLAAGGEQIRITISIGIGYINASDNESIVHDLIECADKALYLAKQNGRNRIEIGEKKTAGS